MKLLTLVALALSTSLPARSQSAFDGDERLQKKVTIRAVGLTMRDLLADLTAQTGIKLLADPLVAEDKTALFAHYRPLSQTLESLAKFFRFTWTRQDGPPPYTYRLTQSLKQRKQEQEELDARLFRTADAILTECREIVKFKALPEYVLMARLEAIKGLDWKKLAPAERAEQSRTSSVITAVLRMPQQVAAARLLAGMNRDQIVDMLTTGTITYSSPPEPGSQPLSTELRDAIWKAFVDNDRQFGRTPDFEPTIARLRFEGRDGINPSLAGMVESGTTEKGGGWRSRGSGFRFPMQPMFDGDDDGNEEPAGWRDIPSFMRQVTMKPQPFPKPPGEPQPLEPPFHARYFDELDRQAPIDLISDAFYSGSWYWLPESNLPVGAVITHLALNSYHIWSISDGFVHFRSRQYVSCRYGEPPYSQLKRWVEMPSDQLATLDGMAELASLPQPQADVALSVLKNTGTVDLVRLEAGFWPYLRFWNALTPGQRALVVHERGIPVQSLRPAQKRLALEAVRAAEQYRRPSGPRTSPPVDEDTIAASAIRFKTEESVSYGVIKPGRGRSSTGGQGRDEAVRRFLRNDPALKDEDVRTIRTQRVQVQLLWDGEPVVSAEFYLPQNWSPVRSRIQQQPGCRGLRACQ